MNASRGIPFLGTSPEEIASAEQEFAEITCKQLSFWIDCLGAPVLVVEKHTPTIRFANATAAAFFRREADRFCEYKISDVMGWEAEQLLGQVWSSSSVGRVGEPFIIRSLVDEQPRLLMVRVAKIAVEGEMFRLFTFTDAPPQGSVTLAGWQDNMMEIMNWFPFGLEIADNADQIQFANAHSRRLFGYEQHELETAEDWWLRAYPDADYRMFARGKWESEIAAARDDNREMTPFDLDVTTAFGTVKTIQFRHRSIGDFNINLFIDVTRERNYERELRLLAGTDPLTGTMNRRRFFEEAALIFKDDVSRSTALLVLDIDRFKDVNDGHGHDAGDVVLREFTQRCTLVLRGMDKLARFGGEEFAVLLPGKTLEEAAEVAERLRAAIGSHPFHVRGVALRITTSIGITNIPAGDAIDAALSRADKGLYHAKQLGRDRIVVIEKH
jgi:diguanylate cyclase (GGDEF)-like protein